MRKYFIKINILFVIIVLLLANKVVFASLPLSGKLIVLDSGHGGLDPGTMYGGIYEKDINLAITLELEKSLSKLGATVILIRNGDYDLSKPNAYMRKKSDFDNRIKLINESKADLYFSIHLNYLENTKYFGPQVFYNEKKTNNKKIAEQIQNALNKSLKTKREVKKIPRKTYMYDKLKVDGVLIECGFLSNGYERELLNTQKYQKRFAEILAEAIAMLKL